MNTKLVKNKEIRESQLAEILRKEINLNQIFLKKT